jgi:hypothetical protein
MVRPSMLRFARSSTARLDTKCRLPNDLSLDKLHDRESAMLITQLDRHFIQHRSIVFFGGALCKAAGAFRPC